MSHVLVAPLSFGGSLTATHAAQAMEQGLKAAQPRWTVERLPLVDGGPGTLEVVAGRIPRARLHTLPVQGPRGEPVEGRWLQLPGELALLELAPAGGPARAGHPAGASTFGTGQLILDALEKGCRRVVIGAGNDGARDGAAGAAAALGVRFLDRAGQELAPTLGQLERVASIDTSRRSPLLARAAIEIWADPGEPGPPDPALARLAALALRTSQLDCAGHPGASAGGDLAWGLLAYAGASRRPAFLALLELCGLERSLEWCDLVLTGEGRLEEQARWTSGPWALARLARRSGKPTVAFVGGSQLEPAAWQEHFQAVVSLSPPWPAEREAAAHGLALAVASWAATGRRA